MHIVCNNYICCTGKTLIYLFGKSPEWPSGTWEKCFFKTFLHTESLKEKCFLKRSGIPNGFFAPTYLSGGVHNTIFFNPNNVIIGSGVDQKKESPSCDPLGNSF